MDRVFGENSCIVSFFFYPRTLRYCPCIGGLEISRRQHFESKLITIYRRGVRARPFAIYLGTACQQHVLRNEGLANFIAVHELALIE